MNMNMSFARYGNCQRGIRLSELIELAKTNGIVARAEDSGCEGCYVEVARWCEDSDQWKRFAFEKLFDEEDATAYQQCTAIAEKINEGNEGASLIHELEDFTATDSKETIK